jgi:hypothetical protein
MSKIRKYIALLSIGLAIMAGLVSAGTFYYNFTSTPYKPDQYGWKQPWTIYQMVDFVEATLNVQGSGYQSITHNYNLTLKNVASDPTYVLLSCNYVAKFENGITQEQLLNGTHTSPLLYKNNSTKYSGTFVPTLYGVGNITMSLTNIQWGVDAPITWTTSVINASAYVGKLTVADLQVIGASRTYIPGNVTFTLKATDQTGTIVSFELKIFETGLVVKTVTDYVLVKDALTPFNYPFTPTSGGALTMQLTITNAHV